MERVNLDEKEASAKHRPSRKVEIPDDPRALLDEYQAAKVLAVSVHKLRRDRWAGGGVPFVKMSGAVRYSNEAINEYILSRTRKSTSDTGSSRAA